MLSTALSLSLQVAFLSTLLNLCVAGGLGYLFATRQFRGKTLLESCLALPMVLPPTVVGYYLLVLLGRQSPFGQWLEQFFGVRLVFSLEGAIIATTVVTFPLVLKPARAAFESVDKTLIDAALTLGLSQFAAFRRVYLPLAWPGILAGLMLAFARAMGEFGATLMLAGSIEGKTQTLSIAIYEAVQAGDQQTANQLALVTSLVCVLLLYLAKRVGQPKWRQPHV